MTSSLSPTSHHHLPRGAGTLVRPGRHGGLVAHYLGRPAARWLDALAPPPRRPPIDAT